jgi:hypothetical protein
MVVAVVRAGLTTKEGKAMNLPWVVLWTGVEANIGTFLVSFFVSIVRGGLIMLTAVTAVIVACVGSFRMLYVQHREKQKPERDTYRMTSMRGGRMGGTAEREGFEGLGSEEQIVTVAERDKG